MSGPIEFTIAFERARLAYIRQLIEQERLERAQRVSEYMAANRISAQQRISAIQAARAAHNQKLRERNRTQLQQVLQEQQKSAVQRHSVDVTRTSDKNAAKQEVDSTEPQLQQAHQSLQRQDPVQSSEAENMATQRDEQIARNLEQISQWNGALPIHETVAQFQGDAARKWIQKADTLMTEYAAGLRGEEASIQSQHLVEEAERIVQNAEVMRAKYEARNLLLRDVIDSLKAIGFFVSDPEFERPSDPTGPVLLKASRGSEQMSASVDLTESIHSVWDGYEGEHCKAAFLDYLEQMKQRGVSVTATRPVITERPILKQKGAQDLPVSQARSKGADHA